MKKIKVGIIQQSNTADIRVNLMNLAKSIEACAAHGAQLIVLQELHNSLYFCQTENTNLFDLAEPIPGPSTGFYSELAAANKAVLVTSLFEKRAPGLYHNTAVVFDRDGSIAGKYRKMHIPDDPAYYEKFYFTPGDIGFEPIQTSLGKLGVLVCWDQWYPEAARLMALKGAELLIYPTAIGWESSDTDDEKARQLNAWIISQRAHAVANGLPVISVNRVGHEPDPSGQTNGILFWGNSFVAGPQGEFLAQAGNDHPENMPIAAGNLFIGSFDVSNAMSNPLKATKFGLPFRHVPTYLAGYYKYKAGDQFTEGGKPVNGKRDICDIYAIMYETSESVPTLDGTNTFTSPNLVSTARINNAKETNEWTYFKLPFTTLPGKFIDKEKLRDGKYNIAIVFTSSLEGDHFNGAIGSTLLIDEAELIYHSEN